MKFYWKYRFVVPVIGALIAAIWLNRADAADGSELRPFEGDWTGRCIAKGSGPSNYAMDLGVRDRGLGRYDWVIRYEGQPARRYIMLPQQAAGHYMLDERNGILIDRFVEQGVIRDQFEVGSSRISTLTWMDGDRVHVSFETFGSGPVRETWSNDHKFKVIVFRPISHAHCILERR